MPPRSATPRLTHFLCIPLVTPSSTTQLHSSLDVFRSDVIKVTSENPDGIPEKAIRPIGTLHLTLGVMSLLTPQRVEEAQNLLKDLDLRGLMEKRPRGTSRCFEPKVHGTAEVQVADSFQPLSVTLRGLESMHKASKTSILYTSPIDEDQRLHSFCCNLKAVFAEVNLLVKDTRPLLLHATLLNTVYVPRAKGLAKGRKTIDSTKILQTYKETVWMRDIDVRKVSICRMGAQKTASGDEEYGIEAEVELPV